MLYEFLFCNFPRHLDLRLQGNIFQAWLDHRTAVKPTGISSCESTFRTDMYNTK